jgi:hypothetical protein
LFKKERRLIDFTLKMRKKEQGARNRAQGRKTQFQKNKIQYGKAQGARNKAQEPPKKGSLSKGLQLGIGANLELKNFRTPQPITFNP